MCKAKFVSWLIQQQEANCINETQYKYILCISTTTATFSDEILRFTNIEPKTNRFSQVAKHLQMMHTHTRTHSTEPIFICWKNERALHKRVNNSPIPIRLNMCTVYIHRRARKHTNGDTNALSHKTDTYRTDGAQLKVFRSFIENCTRNVNNYIETNRCVQYTRVYHWCLVFGVQLNSILLLWEMIRNRFNVIYNFPDLHT